MPRVTRRRVLFALALLFAAFHLLATLLRGAPPSVRNRLSPAFAWYWDGLRMATTYGMFARQNTGIVVLVQGVPRHGERRLLSHSSASKRGFWQRIVDARLRKIQRSMIDDATRAQIGRGYLAYFCRQAERAGTPLDRTELELVYPKAVKRDPEVVLRVGCGAFRE